MLDLIDLLQQLLCAAEREEKAGPERAPKYIAQVTIFKTADC